MHTRIWKLKKKARANKPEELRAVYVGEEIHHIWGSSDISWLNFKTAGYAFFHKRAQFRKSVKIRKYFRPVSIRRQLKKAA